MALALVAFAAPASASAVEFKMEGNPVADEFATFSGNVEFNALGNGITCTVHALVTVNGAVISLKELKVTEATCVFKGKYANCEFEPLAGMVAAEPFLTYDGLPAKIDLVKKNELTVTGSEVGGGVNPWTITANLKSKAGKVCFTTQNDLTVTDITAAVNLNAGGFVTGLQLANAGGGGVSTDSAVGNTVVGVNNAGGELHIDAAHEKTYKIEPALEIKMGGNQVGSEAATFSGAAEFNSLGNGIECTVDATVTVMSGVPSLTKLEVTESTCKFKGKYANCEFESAIAYDGLPARIDIVNAGSLTVTGSEASGGANPWTITANLKSKTGKTCFTTQNDLTVTDITATIVNDANGFITGIQLSNAGGGGVSTDTAVGNTVVGLNNDGGELHIDAAHAATYKIE